MHADLPAIKLSKRDSPSYAKKEKPVKLIMSRITSVSMYMYLPEKVYLISRSGLGLHCVVDVVDDQYKAVESGDMCFGARVGDDHRG